MSNDDRNTITERRKADLLEHLQTAQDLLKGYEDQTLLESNPTIIMNAKKQSAVLRGKIAEYEAELKMLDQSHASPPSSSQPAISVKENDLLEIKSTLSILQREVQNGFETLIDGQRVIKGLIDKSDQILVDKVTQFIAQGNLSDEELKRTLSTIQRTISVIETDQTLFTDELRMAIQKINESLTISSEISLQHKLEASIPIIPFVLNYHAEFSAGDSVDLQEVWAELKDRWGSLLLRTGNKLWAADIVFAYGKIVDRDKNDPVRSAIISLSELHHEFLEIAEELDKLKRKTDQRSANLNMLMRANEKFVNFQNVLNDFAESLQILSESIHMYDLPPITEINRMQELLTSISTGARTAAGLIATHQSAIDPLKQIKRNLPLLIKINNQVLVWLKQTILLAGD
ncbi:MAG: hypothetical protein WHV66_01390 [Anaerolineales bacterium]